MQKLIRAHCYFVLYRYNIAGIIEYGLHCSQDYTDCYMRVSLKLIKLLRWRLVGFGRCRRAYSFCARRARQFPTGGDVVNKKKITNTSVCVLHDRRQREFNSRTRKSRFSFDESPRLFPAETHTEIYNFFKIKFPIVIYKQILS